MSEKTTTRGSESIDEKVTAALELEKERDERAKGGAAGGIDGEGKGAKGKKDKKSKKAKVDKRSPLEIALDNPELAHLSPEYRQVIAEQM